MTRTALITGTSQRLGLHLCEHLLKDGWQVIALTRASSDALDALTQPNLHVRKLGQYNEDAIARELRWVHTQLSQLDLLVNNASVFETDAHICLIDEQGTIDSGAYQNAMFVHMTLPQLLISSTASLLKKAHGNIVSITDIYSDNPDPAFAMYCSTKAGLQSLTLSAAKKLAPQVRANCIQPGPVQFLPTHTEEQRTRVLSQTLLGFEGGFDPVYKALKFIVDNPYVTGSCIKVDGGRAIVRG